MNPYFARLLSTFFKGFSEWNSTFHFTSFFIFFTNIFYADFSPIFSFVYCILLLKRI